MKNPLLALLVLLFSLLTDTTSYGNDLSLPRGTTVSYQFLENSASKDLQEADHLPISVLEDVFVSTYEQEPHLIFKKNQAGYAEVFSVHPPQSFARSGRIAIHYVYIPDTQGHVHKLRTDLTRHKKQNPLTVVVPLPVVPILWAIKGKDIKLFDDKTVNGFIAETIWDYQVPIGSKPENIETKGLSNQPEKNVAEPSTISSTSQIEQQFDRQQIQNESTPVSGLLDETKIVRSVVNQVRKEWKPPRLRKSKTVGVKCEISSNGDLIDADVSDSSGNTKLDLSVIKAIHKAAPFKQVSPITEALNSDSVTLMFDFAYTLQ